MPHGDVLVIRPTSIFPMMAYILGAIMIILSVILVIIWGAEVSLVCFRDNTDSGDCLIERSYFFGLFHSPVRPSFRSDHLKSAEVVQKDTTNNAEYYRIELTLRDGEVIPLTPWWIENYSREYFKVQDIKEFINRKVNHLHISEGERLLLIVFAVLFALGTALILLFPEQAFEFDKQTRTITVSQRSLLRSREERHSLEGVDLRIGEARGPEGHVHYFVKLVLPSGRKIALNERFVSRDAAKRVKANIEQHLATGSSDTNSPVRLQTAHEARSEGGMYQRRSINVK